MEKVDLLFYIFCESINVRRFFLGLRVVDSLFVFYYLLVCEIEDELVYIMEILYNINIILY